MRSTLQHHVVSSGIILVLVLSACAQAPTPTTAPNQSATSPAAQPSGPKGTIKIAWGAEPPMLATTKFQSGGSTAMAELALTFNSALSYIDINGLPHPQLARELPTLQNGRWVVNPDGSMVTTYLLRENAKWHDGAPLTAQDFLFAYRVYIDPDVPVSRREPESLMTSVEAKDDYTLVLNWRVPYYNAAALWYQSLDPLPRHLLEEKYRADKPNFVFGAEWTTDYVGSGPFRLERWDPGQGVLARAFNDWVLGPPKAAALDIRFITDSNTITANLLAGEIDMSGLPWFGPTQADGVRDQWVGAGRGWIFGSESRMQHADFQFRDVPGAQPALADLRVRQALMHGLDREAVAEVANLGFGGSVADVFLLRTDPVFPDVDRAIIKYPYNPTRGLALLGESGWRRSSVDAPLTDAAGRTFPLEIWGTSSGIQDATIMANNWKSALGIDSSVVSIPPTRAADNEYRASFTGVSTTNHRIVPENFVWNSKNLPLAQNRWSGQNRGSFIDSEMDGLLDAQLSARSPDEWRRTTVALHKRFTETVGTVSQYYPVDIVAARNGVKRQFMEHLGVGNRGLTCTLSGGIVAATEDRTQTHLSYQDLLKTGPGTIAGRYLRSFWQPIYRAADLVAGRAKPIRIMSDDLTLYRGQVTGDRGQEPRPHPSPLPEGEGTGRPHLLAFRCAHRGTQLSTGWVEGEDLRCFYGSASSSQPSRSRFAAASGFAVTRCASIWD
ncbi:MAG: hypothetical protein HW416_3940 [Chloroflexi bacterium]|nr:hypothetical protein [Chloroflexota bacterium]